MYYAREIFGPYTAHQANPVKTDIRSSRPAGTPFYHNGYLYRPAQDCSVTYGGSIIINKINKLSPHEFDESVVKIIEPFKDTIYNKGIHTIAYAGDYTLVDGKRFTFIYDNYKFQLRRKINKLLFGLKN